MNDVLLMGGLHGFGQDLHDAGGLAGGQGRALDFLGERAAGAELQREKRQTVVLADFVDLDDVGMLQARDGLRFSAEARQVRVAGVAAREDHLEGDHAMELEMACLIDHAHAAPAQHTQDLVSRNNRKPLQVANPRSLGKRAGRGPRLGTGPGIDAGLIDGKRAGAGRRFGRRCVARHCIAGGGRAVRWRLGKNGPQDGSVLSET
jgi:hypothetical protein